MSYGGGSMWANWSGVATLQHGGQYGICAQGSYSFPNDSLFFSDGPNSCSAGTMIGRRAYTTIDRSKPTAALTLAGGAQYTKDPAVALKVDFADDVAGPFPANFLCFQQAKSIRVSITAGAAGRVALALVRSGRVFSQATKAVGAAGTYGYVLKLPKGAKPGAYSLKATYTPAGGRAATKTRKVTLAGKAARRARASSRPGERLTGGAVALPDGRFAGERPARTFPARALAG